MPSFDWSNMKFTPKEVFGALALVFTISGTWANVQSKVSTLQMATEQLEKKVNANVLTITELQKEVSALKEENKIRQAVEDVRSEYYPLHKVKNK